MERIQRLFRLLESANPQIAGKAALTLFTHPMAPLVRTEAERRLVRKAQAKLAEAERADLRVRGFRIATYRFAHAAEQRQGTALLVHGWTSTAAFMTASVDQLRARGFDVVAFDMPAHGQSSGRRALLMDCVLTMLAVAKRYGPIDRVIAHSFGGPVSTLALVSELSPAFSETTHLLFIASPNRLADVTEEYARAIGISREVQRVFEDMLVEPFGGDLEAMDANILLAGLPNPLTIIHSTDDHEVRFDAAERFAQLGENVALQRLEGLGHRRILHARPGVEAVLAAV